MTFQIISLSFGVGSWIVGAVLKKTPEEWVDRIKINLNEEGVEEGDDVVTKVYEKIKGSFKRSETERLLDS